MTFWRQWLGRYGESLAEKTLKKGGCTILERNFSSHFGEVDIVARCDDYLVFCEVRSRKLSHLRDFPVIGESVHRGKCRRLVTLAEHYLQSHPDLQGCFCRFDVVLVAKLGGNWHVEWIKDAFRPGW